MPFWHINLKGIPMNLGIIRFSLLLVKTVLYIIPQVVKDNSIKQSNEQHLWGLMCAGNPTALNTLFNNYYNDLYFYGLKLVNNHDRVVDAIQDVFANIWESRKRISKVEHVKAYLFTALRNNLLQNTRNKYLKRVTLSNENKEYGFEISPEEIYLSKESKLENELLINNLLAGLSSKQKEIVYLKFYNNYTNIEISKILAIKQQSVANLLSRTLNILRKKKIQGLHLFLNLLLFVPL
ncbi:MAG: hypothetical protein DRJ09_06830 [Bacteroidetes bacterium]|nr:MAG: hypothetical protein DRJ09_06830 [Bacteroidota bacterium]